jgi:hypothetical protein
MSRSRALRWVPLKRAKHMPFDPIKAARRLLKPFPAEDKEREEERRVIDLYRLQVAIYFPVQSTLGPETVTDHTGRDRVENMILHACWMATIRVMEAYLDILEEDKRKNPDRWNTRPGANFHDKTISDLIKKYLWNEREGLHPLTELGSRQDYDERVKKQREDARPVVAMVQLLLQAEETLKELFPTSNAISAVSEVVGKRFGVSRRTMGNYWADMKPTAVFLWLLLEKKFPVDIVRINRSGFFEKTLLIAKNTQLLKRFFRSHDQIAERLNTRGFDFPVFDVTGSDVQGEQYSFEPISASDRCALETVRDQGTID